MRILALLFFLVFTVNSTHAETFEVKMLNRGKLGTMVFEPDYLVIKPGDSVKFIATQRSHNAASIDTMLPEGATPFKGKIDEELEVTFDKAGYYGIKCTPHYAMGMVMLIRVGDAAFPESYRSVKHPGLAQKRFQAIFDKMDIK